MSLEFAILAVLSDKPRSGYEITKKFSESVSFFWSATHQQIYKELGSLEDEGLVKFKEVPQDKNPSKKVYSLTGKGTSSLKSWIKEETPIRPVKDELLVKIFCAHLVTPKDLAEEIRRLKQMHLKKYEAYLEIEQAHFTKPHTLPNPVKFQYLTLQRGISYERGWLDWCKTAEDLLSTMDDS